MLIESADPNNPIACSYQIIENIPFMQQARELPGQGNLRFDDNVAYCYLSIDANYSNKLFPLIKAIDPKSQMPLAKNSIGPHITVLYSIEPNAIEFTDTLKKRYSSDKLFSFQIQQLIRIDVFQKVLYVLTVESAELTQLRIEQGLGKRLNYHGLLVPFHITLASHKP